MYSRNAWAIGLGVACCLIFCLVCNQNPVGPALDDALAPAPESTPEQTEFDVLPSGPPKIDLDQVRNGSGSANSTPAYTWQNGNVNASQAHMVEGYAIPYRARVDNVCVGSKIRVVMGYDVLNKGGGSGLPKNAIDYLTHYQHLSPHARPIVSPACPPSGPWPHCEEQLNPLDQQSTVPTNASASYFTIPQPVTCRTVNCVPGNKSQPCTSYTNLSNDPLDGGHKHDMTIFGGTISKIEYTGTAPDLISPVNQEQRIAVEFTPSAPNVILAWGGHIGHRDEWGCPNFPQSAGGISGSPYHMRLVSWSYVGAPGGGCPSLSNLGNTDRSLSAGAVIVPTGACCVGFACSQMTEGDCNTAGGAYHGDGSPCVSGICGCIITCPGDREVECGTYTCALPPPPSVTGTATCTGEAGCTATHTDSCASACGNTGTITRTWSCGVNGGTPVTCDQIITIVDTHNPTPTCPGPLSVQCDADVPDPDASEVTCADTCGDATASWISDVPSSGTCPKTITRTYRCTDDCGHTADCTQIITVNDTTAPELSNCPDPKGGTYQCLSDIPDPPDVTAHDNCDGDLKVDFRETQSNPDSDCHNTITRTWTAMDACGNPASCTQTITVNDNTPPTFSCPKGGPLGCNPGTPNHADLPTCESVKAMVLDLHDNCDPEPRLDCDAGDVEQDGCQRSQTFTLTATDACGNTSTPACEVTLTWTEDTTPPTFDNCMKENPLNCVVDPTTVPHCENTPEAASDNCDANPTVECCENPSDDPKKPPCGNDDMFSECLHMRTLKYTATDACGNTATCTRIFTWNQR